MNYNKGEQITVGKLKEYLTFIPDNVKIYVGIGAEIAPLHYLVKYGEDLMFHPNSYMQDAAETNLRTVLSFNVKK